MKFSLNAINGFIPAIFTLAIWATPFSMKTNNILIAAFGVYLIVTGWRSLSKPTKSDLMFFVPLILFVAYLVGFIWAVDRAEGWSQIVKRLSLIVFPFIFFMARNSLSTVQKDRMLYAFVLFALGASLICYVNAINNIIENQSFKMVGVHERPYYYFAYLPLTEITDIHPIYMSMYANFGILIFLCRPFSSKVFVFLAVGYFVVFNALVASKAGLIVMGVIFVIYFLYTVKNKLIALGFCALAGLSFLIVLNSSTFLKERFLVPTDFRYDVAWAGYWNSTSQRIAIWSCAIEAISNKFPLGYGTSNGQIALHEVYIAKGYTRGIEDDYNAHNEFFSTMLDLGIFGIIPLLAIFAVAIVKSIKTTDMFLMSFIVMIFVFCLVEVVLTRRSGLNFFCFFYSFLSISDPSKLYLKSQLPVT